ncbi:hypothetical protein FACS1894132_09800 [Clostridia bacterium]|nr:hypothetical protein FACS1894132_09800 [Clostridia bacterium]
MNDRIKILREYLNITKTEFGKRIGVTVNNICDIESKRRNPGNQTIILICDKFNVNEEWLRTGDGEMFTKPYNAELERLKEQFKDDYKRYEICEFCYSLSENQRVAMLEFVKNFANKDE